MKKQYIQPEMMLIQLNHSASLLAGSQVGMSSDSQNNNAALSPRGNFFDYEEEEY
jgi:hypothetical protein